MTPVSYTQENDLRESWHSCLPVGSQGSKVIDSINKMTLQETLRMKQQKEISQATKSSEVFLEVYKEFVLHKLLFFLIFILQFHRHGKGVRSV